MSKYNGGMSVEKILILGASGLVGRALIEELKIGFDLFGTYSSSSTTPPY